MLLPCSIVVVFVPDDLWCGCFLRVFVHLFERTEHNLRLSTTDLGVLGSMLHWVHDYLYLTTVT